MAQIVTVNVSQQVAPFPDNLQKTGALVSQGGTNTAPGTTTFLSQLSDLTPHLLGALAITSAAWASSVVTITTTAPHGFTNADVIPITISGFTPSGYNGTFNCTITGASTFTYPLVANPGSVSVVGMYTNEDVAELLAMATTYFAQGTSVPVYVIEFGPGSPAEGVSALTAFLVANQNAYAPLPGSNEQPSRFYIYVVMRSWASESSFQTLCQSYEAPTAMQYFFTTVTLSNMSNFTNLNKCVFALVEAPTVNPLTEFTVASCARQALSYDPQATGKVAPFSYRFVYGVTPWPQRGNQSQFTTLQQAGVNFIAQGSEGGISNTCIFNGTLKDVRPFNYWYSIDWVQINVHLNVANAIFNGSNNPVNPLYYNQQGINRLSDVIANTMQNGQTFGLVLGDVVQTALDGPQLDAAIDLGVYAGKTIVNAIPFIQYSNENPGDYAIGQYKGYTITYVPLRGFEAVTIGVVASDFVSA